MDANNPVTAGQGNDPGTPRPPEPKEGVPEYVLADPGSQLDPEPPAPSSSGITLTQYAILVAAGAFATTFAQHKVLALYPTTFLLKDHMHLKREDVAVFFFWATFAWNLKPIAGILTDAFPLFGTRRRSYMVLGALTAGILWFVMGMFKDAYFPLLVASMAMNVATVFASTVMGGLMVEAGQAFASPGRISALRQFVQSVSQIAAPLLGGWLASKVFGWKVTTTIGGATVLSLGILTFFVLRERRHTRVAPTGEPGPMRPNYRLPIGAIVGLIAGAILAFWMLRNPEWNNTGKSLYAIIATFLLILGIIFVPTRNPVIVKAQGQLVQIMQSRTLWMAVIMLFLVYIVPGMGTALTYRQEDTLKFTKTFIGSLGALEGVFGVIGAVLYGVFCRKFNLRVLLVGSIAINAVATLMYLPQLYAGSTAPVIHSLGGFLGVLSELALMDLAVRSTPAGCEALGFALMMSVRNFGIGINDILGTKMLDQFHFSFQNLVLINASTTALVLVFVPFLPRLIMDRKEAGQGGDLITKLMWWAVAGLIIGVLFGHLAAKLSVGSNDELVGIIRILAGLVAMLIFSGVGYSLITRNEETQA